MKSFPKVLAATLTWNESLHTARCLDSLLTLDYPGLEVAVVDNGSNDGTYELLRGRYLPAAAGKQVAVIRHRENFGYGEGINGQIRHAIETGAGYLFSVDNDVTVEPETLKIMVQAAEEDRSLGLIFGRHVSGGFFLARMEAVKKAGYLNPRYFIYYDDQDWFKRLAQAGYTQRRMPEAVFYHQGAATIGRESRAFYYYRTRNQFYYEKRHSPALVFFFFAAARILSLLCLEIPSARLLRNPEAAKGKAEGLFDFLRGKWGPKDFKRVTPPVWKRFADKLLRKRAAPLSQEQIRILMKKRPLRIQVNLDWNIGDEIMASPVLERLKEKYPGSQLDVLARFPALFENNPYVDSINAGKAFGPDLYLDLHHEIRHRKRSDYLAEMAGVTGWGAPRIYLKYEEVQAAAQKWGVNGGGLQIALCPEVWWLARRWPRERWIELARRLQSEKNARLFILGKEDTTFPVGTNLVGKTGLRESAAVMSSCDLFIGHDSGPLYMALAVGTPSVGLYGPLDPQLLYPETAHFTAVWTEVPCRGCWPESRMIYRDHCPKIVPDCMTSISTETVWQAVIQALAAHAPGKAGTRAL